MNQRMDRSQRRAGLVFAIAFLVSLAEVMVAFNRYYAPYVVWENGEETARHFIAHAQAIQAFLALSFVHGLGAIVMLTALYVILRPVNRGVALFAAFSRLTYAIFWFILMLDLFGAMRTLGGAGTLRAFGPDGLAALAGCQIDSSRDAYYIGLAFNGLGSALFAWVFFQSRYVPRLLALWGVVASLFEGICGFVYLIDPGFNSVVSVDYYELPLLTFELALCFLLLFKGLKSPVAAVP